ncbi:MAG: DNA-binding protein [Chitinivibrionales bacterium]|nr:DNA-binding protein [Chitinivibrionales bacterium]MBD3356280.1 DNA-binding protein [Chitinivibrionales bacterium]
MTIPQPTNQRVAETLRELADTLERMQSNEYRVRAYRTAASAVENADYSVSESVRGRIPEKIRSLPGIGPATASSIEEIVTTGKLGQLDRLKAEESPEDTFKSLPGVGTELAERIHQELGISSLEELEQAAHEGRLDHIPGFGRRRVKGLKEALNSILSRSARRREKMVADKKEYRPRPPIDILIETDREYRDKAESKSLPVIAPKRFNPEHTAWLPIMHTEKKGWRLTAMYSNTARAHQLGTTHEWVVIYYRRNGFEEQCTVVPYGKKSEGKLRVVRGRERESLEYQQTPVS